MHVNISQIVLFKYIHFIVLIKVSIKGFHKTLFQIFFVFCLFRATPAAHGGSQARGRIRAAAAGLRQSHSNTRSKPSLRPTPQLTATRDPQPTEQGQGSNLQPGGSQSDSLTTVPQRELPIMTFLLHNHLDSNQAMVPLAKSNSGPHCAHLGTLRHVFT